MNEEEHIDERPVVMTKAKQTRKKKQPKIILEEESSDDEQEIVIRRVRKGDRFLNRLKTTLQFSLLPGERSIDPC